MRVAEVRSVSGGMTKYFGRTGELRDRGGAMSNPSRVFAVADNVGRGEEGDDFIPSLGCVSHPSTERRMCRNLGTVRNGPALEGEASSVILENENAGFK